MNSISYKNTNINVKIEYIAFYLDYLIKSKSCIFNNNELKLMFDKTMTSLSKLAKELKDSRKITLEHKKTIFMLETATRILVKYNDLGHVEFYGVEKDAVIGNIFEEIIRLITNDDLKKLSATKRYNLIYSISKQLFEDKSLTNNEKNMLLEDVFFIRLLSNGLYVNKYTESYIKVNDIIEYMNIIKDLNVIDLMANKDLENKSLADYCKSMKPILINSPKIKY